MRKITGLGVGFWIFSMLFFTACPQNNYKPPTLFEGVLQWVWGSGSDTINQSGVCVTQGTVHADNVPGARSGAGAMAGTDGNLWLFGGYGCATNGGYFYLNDLWKYNEGTQQWAWISGASENYQYGVYGGRGVAASTNVPGGRYGMASWIDGTGDLWVFGGFGLDSDTTGNGGYLNDLWKYDVSAGLWTWMSGSTTTRAAGVYGALGLADSDNVPGARRFPACWADGNGNLWLFGGYGYATDNSIYTHARDLNDLWKYTISTGQWTWISGSSTVCKAGIYGTRGTAAVANVPGSRNSAATWIDASGNLWLFGGSGYDKTMAAEEDTGYLNDLWKFNVTTSQWTWIAGSDTRDQKGVYGTLYQPAASNTPGGRMGSSGWYDASGALWLFGGLGYDKTQSNYGCMNDLWRFDTTTSQWAWVTGSNTADKTGTYGTRSVIAKTNTPGGRYWAATWKDYTGNFLLFGGRGMGNDVSEGYLNDLWGSVLQYVSSK